MLQRHAPICNPAATSRQPWLNTNHSLPGSLPQPFKTLENCLPAAAAPRRSAGSSHHPAPQAHHPLTHTHTHDIIFRIRTTRNDPWCSAHRLRSAAQHSPSHSPVQLQGTPVQPAAQGRRSSVEAVQGMRSATGSAPTCCNCGRVDLAHKGTPHNRPTTHREWHTNRRPHITSLSPHPTALCTHTLEIGN
jgi:hypothetical protein